MAGEDGGWGLGGAAAAGGDGRVVRPPARRGHRRGGGAAGAARRGHVLPGACIDRVSVRDHPQKRDLCDGAEGADPAAARGGSAGAAADAGGRGRGGGVINAFARGDGVFFAARVSARGRVAVGRVAGLCADGPSGRPHVCDAAGAAAVGDAGLPRRGRGRCGAGGGHCRGHRDPGGGDGVGGGAGGAGRACAGAPAERAAAD